MDITAQLLAVFFVFLLLGACVWALRSRGLLSLPLLAAQGRRESALRVLDQLALSPQHRICLIQYRDKEILIALAGSGCTVIDGKACGVAE